MQKDAIKSCVLKKDKKNLTHHTVGSPWKRTFCGSPLHGVSEKATASVIAPQSNFNKLLSLSRKVVTLALVGTYFIHLT